MNNNNIIICCMVFSIITYSYLYTTTTHRPDRQKQQEQQFTITTDVESKSILKKPHDYSQQTTTKQITHKSTTTPKKVINKIMHDDLGYYKMFSWHYPDSFILKVNGQPVESNAHIMVQDPIITIAYDYEWTAPWGKQIGTKEVKFEIPIDVDTVEINFDTWKVEERIRIKNAKKISEEKLVEQKKNID